MQERVLVLNVDDDEAGRYAKTRALRLDPNLEIAEADTGAGGLQIVKERRPALVMLDVKLPDINGLDVCKQIKAAYPEILVLQTSASFITGEDKARGLDGGADSYLTQPFEPIVLLASVRALLRIRAAEVARRESEANFRLLADNIPSLCWMANADGYLYWYNRRWYDYTGTTFEEMQGWGWQSVHDPDVLPSVMERWQRSISSGSAFEMTFPLKGKDGILRPFLTRIAPLRNERGELTRWFGTNTDVTAEVEAKKTLQDFNVTLERRVAEAVERRLELEGQLRQSQKMEAVGQLTGGIAHDFNNLLQIVSGNLELLTRKLPEDAAQLRRYTENAKSGVLRAATLTQRLLAFSRRQPLMPQQVETNNLIAGMSDMLARTLGESVEVEAVLAAGLWTAEADPHQLESSILNLAINARDAMPGGGRLTVETANAHLDEAYVRNHLGVSPGQYVMIAVSDTGVGMDGATLERAFEPFFTTKDVGKGTGLGLSMVYGFVKQSGGHISIHSALGEGTKVKLYLPRLQKHKEAAPLQGRQAAVRPASETVLVVEDDPDVRSFSVEALRDMNYQVFQAADAATALALVDAGEIGEIHLIFTDVVLPKQVNGPELVTKLLQRFPMSKVLFTTGYGRDAIVHEGRLDPGVHLLTKPFTLAGLASKVRAVLES